MPNINEIIKGLQHCTKNPKIKNHEKWGLKKEPECEGCPNRYTGCCEYCLMRDSLTLLKEQPKWIPVSERKPKSMSNKVIVYLEHEDLTPMIGYGHFERYQGEEMWYDLETCEQFSKHGYTVTYWMPMPKSPDGKTLILC